MKQAIHFGGGNIGRGFIGELLVRSGYEVTFVDVAEALVDEINARRAYDIEIVAEKNPCRACAGDQQQYEP